MNLLHWPIRMHIVSVGVSKFCFLFSLGFCGLLLLLIPSFQPPARQVHLPQPRTQVRLAQKGQSHLARVPVVSGHVRETVSVTRINRSSAVQTELTRNDNHSPNPVTTAKGETVGGLPESKTLDVLELKDIFIAVKTTKKYRKSRLELLIQTWISQAKEHVRRAAIICLLGYCFIQYV